MGSGLSSFLLVCSSNTSPVPAIPPETNLGDLPESVVGSILVHLNPQQICRFASLNRAFRHASSAEFVWESKLPKNYDLLLLRVFGDNELASVVCKKQIYAKLSAPSSIDGGTKVWLRNRYLCFMKLCLIRVSDELEIMCFECEIVYVI